MPKIEEARAFLEEVGMPKAQQTDIGCLTLLAMALSNGGITSGATTYITRN